MVNKDEYMQFQVI